MSTENAINSQDILDAIDLDKINYADKKKRGRPKKTQQIINPTTVNKLKIVDKSSEQEEMILHLPISTSDIKNYKNKHVESKTNNEKEIIDEENTNTDSVNDEQSYNYIKEEMEDANNLNKYILDNNKLKLENNQLRKYLLDITPMYFTEIKLYPSNLQIFDLKDNIIIPKKTNINCWWCTYKFDCLPSFIPDKYHDNKFYVFGCFCSFNCAGAYNLNLNDERCWSRYSLMKQLYYLINKDNISSISDVEINISPPKEILKKYGGIMTIEEYRKNSKIIGREYHSLMPPFIPINVNFEETTNVKTDSKTINISNILNREAKDKILIKRNKPLNNIASQEIDNYFQ